MPKKNTDCLALISLGWMLRNCLALTSPGWAELTQGTESGFTGLSLHRVLSLVLLGWVRMGNKKKWSAIELALHFAGLGVF